MNSVQDLVRHDFTFQFDFVGSVKRQMVTQDIGSNVGFDFDVNLQVNDDEDNFSAKEIKNKIRAALDQIASQFGYDHAEDSTRVLTIKLKDRKHSKVLHSCDFAIVNNYMDDSGREHQQYIRFHKKQKTYTWEEQPNGYYLLAEKSQWIKEHRYWNEMRKLPLRPFSMSYTIGKCGDAKESFICFLPTFPFLSAPAAEHTKADYGTLPAAPFLQAS